MSKVTIYYHAPCNDGSLAAWIARKKLREKYEEVVCDGMSNNDYLLVSIAKTDIVFLDISWKYNTMKKMQEESENFLLIDHHKSAEKELKGLSNCIFDMNKSACMMTWEYYYPQIPMPEIVRYVGLRDIWQHKDNKKALYFTNAIGDIDIDGWDEVFNKDIAEYLKLGEAIELTKPFYLKQMAQCKTEFFWAKYKIKVNLIEVKWPWTSDLGEYLASKDTIAMLWSRNIKYKCFNVSLRSVANGIDVSTIATDMGGGGHQTASGFRMKELPETLFKYKTLFE